MSDSAARAVAAALSLRAVSGAGAAAALRGVARACRGVCRYMRYSQ
jgi:hypothetical protein